MQYSRSSLPLLLQHCLSFSSREQASSHEVVWAHTHTHRDTTTTRKCIKRGYLSVSGPLSRRQQLFLPTLPPTLIRSFPNHVVGLKRNTNRTLCCQPPIAKHPAPTSTQASCTCTRVASANTSHRQQKPGTKSQDERGSRDRAARAASDPR